MYLYTFNEITRSCSEIFKDDIILNFNYYSWIALIKTFALIPLLNNTGYTWSFHS